MTVKSSLDLSQKIKPCSNRICKACGLYLNQLPVVEKAVLSNIFWVGLSAVQFEEGIEKLPLSPLTKSGALIESIETPLKGKYHFYKTNLVKCLPLKEGKIRYPLEHEMDKCFPNFEFELEVLKPSIVFLLGKQVASFVMKKISKEPVIFPEDFDYKTTFYNGTFYVPVHHPSYILVYKRKQLDLYIENIQKIYKKIIQTQHIISKAA